MSFGEKTMQTNIETIYRRYIKPLSPDEQIKLLAKMADELANSTDTKGPAKKLSLLELEGLGAEIWEGIDAQEYVDELRNEWEHRP